MGVPLTVPLTSPPLQGAASRCEKPVHRSRNPMRPKRRALIRFGAFGCVLWKSSISCGASRSRSGIHEFSSRPYPFHLTKYSSLLPFILLSITSSISYLRSPPTISGGGGGHGRRPTIGSGGAGMSLTTWKTGWSRDIDGGSFRRYACEPTGRTTGKGPKYRCANFFEGRVVLMSDASRKTFSPIANVGAGVRRWLLYLAMSSFDFERAARASSRVDFIRSANSLTASSFEGGWLGSKPIRECLPVTRKKRAC